MLGSNFCQPGDLLCVLTLPSNVTSALMNVQHSFFLNIPKHVLQKSGLSYATMPMLSPVIPLGLLRELPSRHMFLQEAKTRAIKLQLEPQAYVDEALEICGMRCLLRAYDGWPCASFYKDFFACAEQADGRVQSRIYLADICTEKTSDFHVSSEDVDALLMHIRTAIQEHVPQPLLNAQTHALSAAVLRIESVETSYPSSGIITARRYSTIYTQKLSRRRAKPASLSVPPQRIGV